MVMDALSLFCTHRRESLERACFLLEGRLLWVAAPGICSYSQHMTMTRNATSAFWHCTKLVLAVHRNPGG